jgi:hypothetical protein
MRARIARIAPAISSEVSSRSAMSIKVALISASGISPSNIRLNRASDWARVRVTPAPSASSRLHHEIRQHGMAMLGGDAFGVELHAVDRQVAVAEAHDMAVVAGGVDDQLSGMSSTISE